MSSLCKMSGVKQSSSTCLVPLTSCFTCLIDLPNGTLLYQVDYP